MNPTIPGGGSSSLNLEAKFNLQARQEVDDLVRLATAQYRTRTKAAIGDYGEKLVESKISVDGEGWREIPSNQAPPEQRPLGPLTPSKSFVKPDVDFSAPWPKPLEGLSGTKLLPKGKPLAKQLLASGIGKKPPVVRICFDSLATA